MDDGGIADLILIELCGSEDSMQKCNRRLKNTKTPQVTLQKQTPPYGEPVASDMCFEFSRFWKLVVSPSPLLAKVGVDMYVMYPVVGGDVLFENADQYVPKEGTDFR